MKTANFLKGGKYTEVHKKRKTLLILTIFILQQQLNKYDNKMSHP